MTKNADSTSDVKTQKTHLTQPVSHEKPSLRRRLTSMLLLLAGLIFVNIVIFNRIHHRIDVDTASLANYVKLYKLSRRIQISIETSSPEEHRSMERFLLNADEFDRDINNNKKQSLRIEVESDANSQLPLLIEGLDNDWQAFLAAYQALRSSTATSAIPSSDLISNLNKNAEELQASIIAITFTLQSDVDNRLHWLEKVMLGIAGADFLVLGIIMLWLRRHIAEPLEQITETARRLANADFSARVVFNSNNNHQKKSDEIADLGDLINQTAIQAQALISDFEKESNALREAEAKFRSLSEQSLIGIYMIQDGGFIYVNPRFAETFDYPVSIISNNLPVPTLIHPDDWETVKEHLRRRIEGEVHTVRYEFRGIKSDGSVIPVEVIGSAASYRGRPAVIGTLLDHSARKLTEAELQRIHRMLQVLSACNQSLVHADKTQTLTDAICNSLVKLGGFPLACISLSGSTTTHSLRLVACAGPATSYAKNKSDDDRNNDDGSEAFRSHKTVICRNISLNPKESQWRDDANMYHLASSAAIPLLHNNKTLGVLHIYSSEHNAFTQDEIQLLNELADDLAYGLFNIKARAQIDEQATELLIQQRAIESSSSGVMITRCDKKADNPIIYVNAAFESITGYSREEVQGRNGRFLLSELHEQAEIERLRSALRRGADLNITLRSTRRDTSVFWSEISLSAIRDAQNVVTHFVSTLNDVSERIRYQNELQHHSTHDTLTGLANRVLLNDRIEQALAHAYRSQRYAGFILLDIDRFKLINDSLGHPTGDELLRLVAARLASIVRKGDTVARIASDQFVIVLPELESPPQINEVVNKIEEAFLPPFVLAGQEAFVSASIGISLAPDNGSNPESLLNNAEVAMGVSKARGGNGHCLYSKEMGETSRDRISLETDLRRGIERNELELFYQPKVTLQGGKIIGAEALIRWRHPQRGLVPPLQFIPLAEETGLIATIGDWVIQEAMNHLKQWEVQGVPVTKIAVNLSARQFRDHELLNRIKSMLNNSNVAAQQLELELTESMLMQRGEATISTLHALHECGFSLAIDDFGTGYSSLSYLQRFPIDTLKIDRSFVKDLETSHDSRMLAETILMMASNLGKSVVAEGVETSGQAEILRQAGCEIIQGFLYSRPVPLNEFTGMLRLGHLLPKDIKSI